ncbi:MAG: glutamine--fructose-6-phosphate transaminase (isomerizing) [Magnetococcales bacterium]|nr:glutamine--fructose-6-phosphate transaminase (isomerizing) [Magnetococcales bacterium]
MCGIIGVISQRNVTPMLLEGLKRLEYRGYDSAGIALTRVGSLEIIRALGKLVELEKKLSETPRIGYTGIGHTRWATHGAPTERNAHPHSSERVAVVHNGIIENHHELRQELEAEGVVFASETDTETVPHLIERELNLGASPEEAALRAVRRLQGAFALGIIFKGEEDLLIAARRGSPLLIGQGDGENFIASDATPLVPYTRRMIYLKDDDVAVLTRESVRVMDLQGRSVSRPILLSNVSAGVADKGPHRHYMLKEIYEQPTMVGETLKGLIHSSARTVDLSRLATGMDLSAVRGMQIVACGTSWHAACVAKYWIEQMTGVPVLVDIASEYRYRQPPPLPDGLMLVISQSGETADTLAALRHAKGLGMKTLAIVNVMESTIAREADGVLYTQAGPEIGVASTKAFTTQLAVLACLSLGMAKAMKKLSPEQETAWVDELMHLPSRMEQVLTHDEAIRAIAAEVMHARGFLYLGRGTCFPIALEGALKLKEISYIHAEGYAAGEMKHGPIALIDKDLPVVVLAPRDRLHDKVMSNLEETRARGGRVLLIAPSLEEGEPVRSAYHIPMIAVGEFSAPMLYVLPLQLLAYHIAVLKGADVDQPRNLAKSVTVE